MAVDVRGWAKAIANMAEWLVWSAAYRLVVEQ
jgi:hypothetical protein